MGLIKIVQPPLLTLSRDGVIASPKRVHQLQNSNLGGHAFASRYLKPPLNMREYGAISQVLGIVLRVQAVRVPLVDGF